MYIIIIGTLVFCAIIDNRYHKVRLGLLIFCLTTTFLYNMDLLELSNLVSEISLLTITTVLFFLIIKLFTRSEKNDLSKISKMPPLGDDLLFLIILILDGVEKGLLVIIVGLFLAVLWLEVRKIFWSTEGKLRRVLPLYPFIVMSLLILI